MMLNELDGTGHSGHPGYLDEVFGIGSFFTSEYSYQNQLILDLNELDGAGSFWT